MSRSLAGALDPDGRIDGTRLLAALAPEAASVVEEGPLRVAYTGQPLHPRETACLFDGVLDNRAELCRMLEVPDCVCTAQLLVKGWRRWQGGLPARMRGDFVLLIWDREHAEGLIARDQLGVRCLYVHDRDGRICFASEIHQLLALLPRRPEPDPVSVAHWISMSSRPGTATLYAGVRRLDPGSMLLLSPHGVREVPYWKPTFREPIDEGPRGAAAQVRGELQRAVARRISPRGATGLMMSGGLDSATVAAFAAREAPGNVRACSAVFPDHAAVDESALIQRLTEHLALPGILADVRVGGLLASALEMTRTWQLPLRSWGDFWARPLLQAAAGSGARVMLGGDGGDEVFGVRAHLLADVLRAGHPLQALRLARELPGAGERPPRRALAGMIATVAGAGALPYAVHRHLQDAGARRRLPAWLRASAARDLLASQDPLAWKRMDGPRWWASAAHGLTRGIEELGLFEHHRQRARSAGIEARHPLLDLDLVELMLRQPPLSSFDPMRNRPLLRAAVAGLLPESVRQRPGKALFDRLIIDSLFGPDYATIRRLLDGRDTELGAYVELARVRRDLFADDGVRDRRPFEWMCYVWRLTTAECWLRAQSDPGGEILPAGVQASAARVVLRVL